MIGIPKKIHYCWFGKNEKGPLIDRCIASWKKYCPEYEFVEWNETNFNVYGHPFTKRMYEKEQWAFVSDYVRLVALEKEGGIYLDTDILLLQSLNPLIEDDCFLGEEQQGIISAGVIGANAHHPYIGRCKAYYDNHPNEQITIPRILTSIFNSYLGKDGIKVYPPHTFYPFDANHIKEYKGQPLPNDVFGVHLWNYSWGHPLNKFFKKIGIYKIGLAIVEKLGIKETLKKLLGFI